MIRVIIGITDPDPNHAKEPIHTLQCRTHLGLISQSQVSTKKSYFSISLANSKREPLKFQSVCDVVEFL